MAPRNTVKAKLLSLALMLLAGLAVVAWWMRRADDSASPGATLRDQILAVQRGESDTVQMEARAVSSAEFRELVELPGLRVLQLDQGRIDDQSLAALDADSPIEHLRLRYCPVGDGGMQHIARLKHLRILNLPHAEFTDAGLRAIAGAERLELLRFASPRITNDGLAPLAKLPALRFLHIIAAPISDDGLPHVEAMQQLESFYIDDTQVTEDGLGKLVEARRDLHIHLDQRHVDSDPRGSDGHH